MDESDSSSLRFSEDDIRYQLELLGYNDVPSHRLQQFAADLERLIANESLQGQHLYDDDESVVSDSTSSVAAGYPTTHTGRDRIQLTGGVHRDPTQLTGGVHREPTQLTGGVHREPTQLTGGVHREPTYTNHKTQVPVHRDHTVYGKENLSHRDHRPAVPTLYNSNSSAMRHGPNELLDSSVASSRSEEPPRRPWWPPPEKKPPMKRKVLRKKGGQAQVFDESITESEVDTDDISYLNEHLHNISLPSQEDQESLVAESDASSSVIYSTSRRRPVSANSLYSHRPSGDEEGVFKPHLPRSFIRPSSAPPKSKHKHDPKTDPVSRHQMYQQAWSSYKAPGEKSRKDLRWSVREQMMYKDKLPKPQTQPRVYLPNTYKVPTEKKRQALRWAVRTTLAQKQMPYSAFEF